MLNLLRIIDLLLALAGLIFLWPLALIIYLLLYLEHKHPLFFQERVGRNKRPFTLIKFRTMRPDTESVGTHLVDPNAITRLGKQLRRLKLDELPQLINVLTGSMSLVGPRPCLFNQIELIEARESLGVFEVRPGITGLAQVNDIDMSTPQKLAEWDARGIAELSVQTYFKLLVQTVLGAGSGDRVKGS